MALRKCSRCGQTGHNKRKCNAPEAVKLSDDRVVKLFSDSKQSKLYQPRAASQWTRTALGALDPSKLNSILKDAERGNLEDFADLCAYMLRTDPQIRSVWMTRVNGVAGSELSVSPAILAEDDPRAEEAAVASDVVHRMLLGIPDFTDKIADMMHGAAVGVQVFELCWKIERGINLPTLRFIPARDVEFNDDWTLRVRTYDGGVRQRWVNISDHPNKFVVHMPHNFADVPSATGEFHAIAWAFVFKRWCEKYMLAGTERMGGGFLYALSDPNTPASARDALLDALEALAGDGAAVFEATPSVPDPIRFLQPGKSPGDAFRAALDFYDAAIAKALLGSGLNVEVGSSGGNRALGESQFDTTTLPRLVADAEKISRTLENQVVKPFIALNRHLFGGTTPPIPRVELRVVNDEIQEVPVDQIAIDAGVVTVDELRRSRGLKEIGGDEGAAIAKIQAAPAAPGFSRWMTPPNSHEAATQTLLSSYLRSPLALALSRKLEDQET